MKKIWHHPVYRSILIFLSTVLLIKLIGWTSFPDKVFPKLNHFFGKFLYGFSSKFSISIGDVFYTILGVLGLIFLVFLIRFLFKKDYSKLKKSFSFLFYFFAGFYLIFNLVWGFNYYKTPIKDAYDVELDSVEELKELAEIYYQKSKILRAQVNENERGVFDSKMTYSDFKSDVEKSVLELKMKYPEIKFSGYLNSNLKKSMYSEVSSYMGVSGYYNPFTNESQYNSINPDTRIIFTQLHETAHQWGFAAESEANFVGFLIGMNIDNIDFQYAINFRAMRSLLNRILWHDPAYVKDFIENRYTDGMKRDREFEIELDKKYSNGSDDAFSLINEAFLRLNNQEGLKSYGRFVELLVGFNRKYKS